MDRARVVRTDGLTPARPVGRRGRRGEAEGGADFGEFESEAITRMPRLADGVFRNPAVVDEPIERRAWDAQLTNDHGWADQQFLLHTPV